ncbi:hypothetical protein HOLleu_42144 [Holothuria leucospilota]|uniref:Endonuclease/exonuclease/phosphatase domain-containing protein n=1 Tax=Holothuria leucospilota TaxID=206669 RepID=A0A9Q0YAQ9_HOLLE|nr:hypothetical protein HOLleu_42144 [Holothuria leucospilota]
MAYVALSRVTSISDLYLLNYNANALYCNHKIQDALSQMPTVDISHSNPLSDSTFSANNQEWTIIHHNIQSLSKHFQDLVCDTEFLCADLLCLTETWQQVDSSSTTSGDSFALSGYSLVSKPSVRRAGGVAVYVKSNLRYHILQLYCSHCVVLALVISGRKCSVTLVTLYRPPSVTQKHFQSNLNSLQRQLIQIKSTYTIFIGDFSKESPL